MNKQDVIIGIDLGTTNSLAASVFDHGPETLQTPAGGPIIPSVLSRRNGGWIVGREAREDRTRNPEGTIFSVKRLMGKDIEELRDEVSLLPFKVGQAQRGLVNVLVGEEAYSPQELSAEILSAVRKNAEAELGHRVEKAVITVPAYFDDAQRQATRDAGRIAGLEVVRIINEPTAAAIAYGLDQKKKGVVAIYDLGGGTFDISILQLTGSVFKVLATHGDTHLGGDDMDMAIAGEIKRRALAGHPDKNLDTPLANQLLRKIAEMIKIDLSRAQETEYSLELPAQEINFHDSFTAATLNELIEPFIAKTLESCQAALKAAGKTPAEIEEVVLVGGSTKVPLVREKVTEFFGKKPNISINPEEVVAVGAAIQGHLLAGGRRDFVLLDVIPLSLGMETLGGTFSKLIMANTTIPTETTELFTTSQENQTGVDINIYQGEREFVKDCRNLGRFRLKGIPPMLAGLPKVKVTFQVDTNGILNVSALEERSGQQAQIEVIPSHGLTNAEIESIMDSSVEHALDDLNQRQLVEFRNTAEAVFRGIDQTWDQAKALLNESELTKIREQMEVVKQVAGGADAVALKREMDILGELTRPLADAIMSQAALTELKTFFAEHRQ